jgi:hypothetical protein
MAGFVTWVGFMEDAVHIEGKDNLHSFASSPDAQRHFCKTCGSTLLFASPRWKGEIHIALAAFPEGVGVQPQAHAFYDRSASWVHLADSLPRLGGETGTEPLPPTGEAQEESS